MVRHRRTVVQSQQPDAHVVSHSLLPTGQVDPPYQVQAWDKSAAKRISVNTGRIWGAPGSNLPPSRPKRVHHAFAQWTGCSTKRCQKIDSFRLLGWGLPQGWQLACTYKAACDGPYLPHQTALHTCTFMGVHTPWIFLRLRATAGLFFGSSMPPELTLTCNQTEACWLLYLLLHHHPTPPGEVLQIVH